MMRVYRIILLGICKRRDHMKAIVLVRLKATTTTKDSTCNHLFLYADLISGEGGFTYPKCRNVPELFGKKQKCLLSVFSVFFVLRLARGTLRVVGAYARLPRHSQSSLFLGSKST